MQARVMHLQKLSLRPWTPANPQMFVDVRKHDLMLGEQPAAVPFVQFM